jgi:peptidoglycan/LPS O-acetylase OafA/YrhL
LSRKIGLDIVRSIAILTVILGHSSVLLENTMLQDFPFAKPIDGVDLFFVLSGFLIGGILLREFDQQSKYFQIFSFWKRRWFRTLPLYFLFLVLNYWFISQNWTRGDINQATWKFFFFLQNFSSPFYDFFWESWSLSVEEWFYFIFPILFYLGLKFYPKKIAFFTAVVLFILSTFIFRINAVSKPVDPFLFDITYKKVVLLRLDSIAYGLLFAWLNVYYQSFIHRSKNFLLLLSILILIVQRTIELEITSVFAQVFYYSISPIALSLSLPFFNALVIKPSWFSNSFTFISKISYSMYLINLSIIIDPIHQNFPNWNGIFSYLLSWTLIIFFSFLLYQFFEKPITNLRDVSFSKLLSNQKTGL